jgi:hypothetical protein
MQTIAQIVNKLYSSPLSDHNVHNFVHKNFLGVHNLTQINLVNFNIILVHSWWLNRPCGTKISQLAIILVSRTGYRDGEPHASKYEFYLCYVAPCVLLKKAAVLVMQCPRVNATKLGKNRSESTLIL